MPATTAAPLGSRAETMTRPLTMVGDGTGVGVAAGVAVEVGVGLLEAPVIGVVQADNVRARATNASTGRRMSKRDSTRGTSISGSIPVLSHGRRPGLGRP